MAASNKKTNTSSKKKIDVKRTTQDLTASTQQSLTQYSKSHSLPSIAAAAAGYETGDFFF